MNTGWRERAWYPVAYMFVVTAVPTMLLLGLSEATRERVKRNERLAFERAVIQALEPELSASLPKARYHELFMERVGTNTFCGAYRYEVGGKVVAYALPIEGQGFWAPIKGVIAINADTQTVRGISFYEQSETPGLGAEIAEDWFRLQFTNVVLAESDPALPFAYAGGEGAVDAVTGGTQTSTRLERFMNERIGAWRKKMRGGE
ncbi:MAG: FMN-binding protein [bacterium]|nr:FMN-binding protein [bacterium]